MKIESVFTGSPPAMRRVEGMLEGNKINNVEKLLAMDWQFHLMLAHIGNYKLFDEVLRARNIRAEGVWRDL